MSTRLIQIFTKNPIPGKVKTRLIPKLGAKGACDVYKQILAKTIANANLDNIKTEIWLDHINPEKPDDIIKNNNSLQLYEQKGNNLGEKMHYAIKNGLSRADEIVLVGSDCPAITKKHYVKLFGLLKNHDLAIIPAVDGGYVALAARKIDKNIFSGITWSSKSVYQDTLDRIKMLGFTHKSLEPLRDLDIFEDYKWHIAQKNIQ